MAVLKVIELIGVSKRSFEDAAHEALLQASKTVRNIAYMKVERFDAKVDKNKIVSYRAHVRLQFEVER